ncbi:hypothetical protein Vadar_018930 [Vaccinium darrowii]|uniref:Uncharacterized protein n=1 Tax=Vaccinium darrowii TaxID=229202 RepID=A0ACB7Y7H0_9ERIC|nr:hypothetical protein Vadar_018930 [Vaccinium darrowii]
MESYRLAELTQARVNSLKACPCIDFSFIFNLVTKFIICYTTKFDKVELEKIVENVSELPDPELDAVVREAFDVAYNNIYAFHAVQKLAETSVEGTKVFTCLGTAVLPSTALMLAIVSIYASSVAQVSSPAAPFLQLQLVVFLAMAQGCKSLPISALIDIPVHFFRYLGLNFRRRRRKAPLSLADCLFRSNLRTAKLPPCTSDDSSTVTATPISSLPAPEATL